MTSSGRFHNDTTVLPPSSGGVAAAAADTARFAADAAMRFPPLGIDIPPPPSSAMPHPDSPTGSDNGMADYEDDIPAGGSAFGSGGTSAPGINMTHRGMADD